MMDYDDSESESEVEYIDYQAIEDQEQTKLLVERLNDPRIGDRVFRNMQIDITRFHPEFEADLGLIWAKRGYLRGIREALNRPGPVTLRAKLRLIAEGKRLDAMGYGKLCSTCKYHGETLGYCEDCEFIDEDHNPLTWSQRAQSLELKKSQGTPVTTLLSRYAPELTGR